MGLPAMSENKLIDPYRAHVAALERRMQTDKAMRDAVGGEFIAVGKLVYYLLRSLGLADGQLVVDVGCGSGRLAVQLAPFPGIRYIGCDIVPRLVEYGSALAARTDWTFAVSDGLKIPCEAGKADFVCFISVFTHLTHEDTFRYFRETARVLKPGGRMVFSFLEFRVAMHMGTFLATVDHAPPGHHLNQFIDRDGIAAWAAHTGLEVADIWGADTNHIPIPEEITWENGARMGGLGNLGQSVAVLRKPAGN
jgi:2-polyprenyl-3-methyl-5-hydroxy-6-metoxy-1,4-benzoquinol methylase